MSDLLGVSQFLFVLVFLEVQSPKETWQEYSPEVLELKCDVLGIEIPIVKDKSAKLCHSAFGICLSTKCESRIDFEQSSGLHKGLLGPLIFYIYRKDNDGHNSFKKNFLRQNIYLFLIWHLQTQPNACFTNYVCTNQGCAETSHPWPTKLSFCVSVCG